jgi:hypothetical protein
MAHFFRIGPGEMQRQCFRRGQHISMSGKTAASLQAATRKSGAAQQQYPVASISRPAAQPRPGWVRPYPPRVPLHALQRPQEGSYDVVRTISVAGRWRWGGPPHRLRRRRSPQEAVEQGMRRRPIPEPRRLHQSVKQILPSVGHGRLSNLTPIKVPVERSAETNENNPGLPIRF